MIIEDMSIEVIEFENLYELLKVEQTHYILKYELDEKDAIYYMISDGSKFALFGFCIDKNHEHENIKVENGEVISSQELTGTTIVTVNVKTDTFLNKVLEYIFAEEKEEKPKKKTKK